jgi:hypothetical protein
VALQTLQQKARHDALLEDVLQMNETALPPEAGTLISLCVSSNPLTRPSAARCVAALEHIKSTLASDITGNAAPDSHPVADAS